MKKIIRAYVLQAYGKRVLLDLLRLFDNQVNQYDDSPEEYQKFVDKLTGHYLKTGSYAPDDSTIIHNDLIEIEEHNKQFAKIK